MQDPKKPGQRYAILIGSSENQVPSLDNLKYTENDIEGLRNVLEAETIGRYQEVLPLFNQPNHEALIKMNYILTKASTDDLVLIYFSGHGSLSRTGKLHLVMSNTITDALEATSIPAETIISYTKSSYCRKIILLLDCCYSGAVRKEFKSSIEDELKLIQQAGRGLCILTSSTAQEVSKESDSYQRSVFTHYIIKGLESGDADIDKDGLVSINDLYSYVYEQIQISKESSQTPVNFGLEVQGKVIIARCNKKFFESSKISRLQIPSLQSNASSPAYDASSGSSVHFELIEGILAQIPGTKLHDGRVITKIEEIRQMKSRVKSRGTMYAVVRLDADSTDKFSSSLGEVAEFGITWFDSAYRMNQITSAALQFGFLSPQILYSGAISTSPELWCSIKEWQGGNSISDLLLTVEVDSINQFIEEILDLLGQEIYQRKHGELRLESDIIMFRDEYLSMFCCEDLLTDAESDKLRAFVERYAGRKDWGIEGKFIHGNLNAGNIIVQGDINEEIHNYLFIDMKQENSNDYLKDISSLIVTLYSDLFCDPFLNYRGEILEDIIRPIGEWTKRYSEQIGDKFYEERLHFWIIRQLLCNARWQVINKNRTFDLEKKTLSTQIAETLLASSLQLLRSNSKINDLFENLFFWRTNFRKRIQKIAKNFIETTQQKNKSILLVSHNEVDSISALKIFEATALYLDLQYKILVYNPVKMTFNTLFQRIEKQNYDVIILFDIGSSNLDLFVQNLSDKEVFILDHHYYDSRSKMVMEIIEQHDGKELITTAKDLKAIEEILGADLTNKIRSFLHASRMTSEEFLEFANLFRNFRIVNPYFFNIDESREITTSTITHFFVKEILPEAILKELSWISVIGIMGDRMDQPQKFAGFNRIVLKEAMEAGKIIRTEEILPFAELKEIADGYIQSLILPDKKDRFSSVPLFAFLIYMLGSIDPELAMQCYEDVPLVAENRYISLVNDLTRILQSIDDFCLVELETRPIIAFDFIETPILNSSLASLLVNQLQERVIVAMTVEPTGLRVSLRVPEKLVNIGYTDARTLAKEVATRLGAYSAGHKTACAIHMSKTDVSIRAQMIHVISILQDSMKEFIV